MTFHPSPDGTTFPSGWNPVYKSAEGAQDLKKSDGSSSTVDVSLYYAMSTRTGGAVTGNNSGVFPDTVLDGMFYVDAGKTGYVEFSSLDPTRTYDVSALASRAGTGTRVTIFRAGGKSGSVQAMNNASQLVVLQGLVPTASGALRVEFTPQNDWAYLNAIKLEMK